MPAPVISQNSFSFLQIGSSGSTYFFLSQEVPAIPKIGIFLSWLDPTKVLRVKPHDQLIIGGILNQWTMGATGVPAVSGIILSRSVGRFVFSGLFRRVN